MHTAEQLRRGQFRIRVDGQDSDIEELLPEWRPHDRFAILVHEPFGAVGASLLVQAAITAHFDVLPARRHSLPVYPEIYAIHVGGRYGDLSPFDFWPARKEVFVEDDPVAVLTALNDRGITRLAVPDVAPSPFDFAQAVSAGWSERNALLERLRSAFAYSGSGRVVKHDIAVSCVDPATSVNPSFVLDPQAALDAFSGLVPQDFEHLWPNAAFDNEIWLSAFAARIEEQPREARSRAASLRRTLLENGCTTETFRRVAADEALGMLVAGNR